MKVILNKPVEIKTLEKKDKSGTFEMAFLEYGDQKVTMFLHPTYGIKDKEKMMQWAAGMEVDIIVYQSNGYTNFKIPTKTDYIDERLTSLESKFMGMYKHLAGQGLMPKQEAQPQPTTEEQLNIADQIDF